MPRRTLYSSSSRSPPQQSAEQAGEPRGRRTVDGTADPFGRRGPRLQPGKAQPAPSRNEPPPTGLAAALRRNERPLLVVAGAFLALLLSAMFGGNAPVQRELTQEDIDTAVIRTLETQTLPSRAVRAYETIRPSVVRVRGIGSGSAEDDGEIESAIGSGVVILDDGTILTNLHVVRGSNRIRVVFHDGMESDADVVAVQPENDLAVLKAKVLPDDLFPATLRGTANLREGDDVVAVGFPFGIGPSTSAGVVSGLRREYRSPEGQRQLSNLIQFDAMANPGSSGGPLVNMDGEVLGIVTAILNPTAQRVFIGIGFAVTIEDAAGGAGLPPF